MQYAETQFSEYPSKISTTVRDHEGPGLGARLLAAWRAHRARERQRAQLARMTDRDLRDIGVTRNQLEFELESPLARALRRLG